MILFIDKPGGMTSYDVIRILKKEFPGEKIGHAGTLDPMATGLLIVAIQKDTKRLTEFLKLPKVYDAEIELGTKTDTGDKDGKILEKMIVPQLTQNELKNVLKRVVGDHEYDLPVYSAIKSGGEPLYKKARRGEKVIPPKRTMVVYEAEFISYKKPFLEVKFHVGSGTYIRSLANDIGLKLGTVATLSKLRRISVGEYKVDNARRI